MNQTQKRLSIIKLAISIGDTETIQLQILKLAPLKTDERIQEIIKGLQAENYAQTQALITEYIETPTEEILQRTSQLEPLTPEEEEEIIEEFDLFRVKPEEEEEKVEEIVDLEGFREKTEPVRTQSAIDYDSLLNLKGDDILPDNISIEEKTLPKEDDFFAVDTPLERYDYTEVIEKDDFFHSQTEEETEPPVESSKEEDTRPEEVIPTPEPEMRIEPEEEPGEETPQETPQEEPVPEEDPDATEEETSDNELSAIAALKRKRKEQPSEYEPITYIDQKLKNMMTQYPPLEMPEGSYASVDAWLLKISNEGYTEKEIEEMISFIQKLAEEDRKAEAAQLLLISAATQSKFAQFMLARSLFKGDLLEKNLPEAFTLINRLAMDDDYAEAICDLGQLYEYGIGIGKDKERAEQLYKEAMELGIKRAKSHYERLHKENRKLFSIFRR
jgi:hypothetical protein